MGVIGQYGQGGISGAGDIGGPGGPIPPGHDIWNDPEFWLILASMGGVGAAGALGSGGAAAGGGGANAAWAPTDWAAGGGAGASGAGSGISSALTTGEFDPNYVYGAGGGASSGSGLTGFLGTPAGKIAMGLLAGVGSAGLGKLLIGNAASGNVPPQLSQLLNTAVQRQQYQNPQFQAKTQGMYAMLPSFARQGTSLTGSLPGLPGAAYDPTGGVTGGLQSLFPKAGG